MKDANRRTFRSGTGIRLFLLLVTLVLGTLPLQPGESYAQNEVIFTGTEFLGRPTDDSVTVNVIADTALDYYFEYGTTSGDPYSGRIPETDYYTSVADEPIEEVIDGLTADTQYYYRMVYRETGTTDWIERDEYSFHTQRPPGSSFTFTMVADSHLGQYGGQAPDELALYEQTVLNVDADQPDFHIDLGDTFAMDPQPLGTGMTEAEAEAAYLVQRPYMGLIGNSVPIYLVIGNHENEEGWNFDDVFTPPDQSLALVGLEHRKLFYPNPVPDGFYSGNQDPLPEPIGGDTFHEDYYAWEWGDALFVVLDPFHYSMTWPAEGGTYGGEGMDGEPQGDRWDWTLGIEQYLWLKDTLENSDATFKFVLSHHVTGGATPYGRGGISAAPYFEWGGQNADGTWGFDTERPASEGWDLPIHQLMVANGVNAFFHGHDHIYAQEELDGIIYLECPKPDDAGYAWEPYGYGYTEGLYPDGYLLPNSGHIRVAVSPTEATVEYVRAYLPGDGTNGEVAHSFTIWADSDNTPPEAADDTATTDEDTAVTIDVLANDSDADGDTLTVSQVSQPTNGSVVNNSTDVTYTPDADYCGSDSFGYTVSDGRGGSDTATVDVSVTCVDDAPVADDQAVSTIENTPVDIMLTASDGDGDPLTFEVVAGPTNGTLSGSVPNLTYTPNTDYIGPDGFTFRVNDGQEDSNIATVSISVVSEPAGVLEFGVVMVSGDDVTVDLDNTYVSPVVVCSVQYDDNTTPVVVRVSNVTPTSFDIRLQNPSGGGVAAENVSYLVVEEGTWTIDGVNLEAQTYLSTVTDEDGSWVGQPQSYGQSYSNPVVLGQVMSDNDPDWSAFWCQGGSRSDPPSATALTTGKTVGEDTYTTREDETIGFIVFEAGHGTIGGVEYEAALGADTVQGVDDSPPYAYTFNTAFATAPQAVLTTLAGMDGPNGGWAQTHGATIATATSLYLSIDEDQIGDSERNHINEQVGYVAFGGTANTPPEASDDSASTDEDMAVTIDVLDNDSDADGDALSVFAVTQPTNGSAVNNGSDVTYTPDADYCGSDSFGYTVSDGNGGSDTATVDVSVTCVNDAPVADGQAVSTIENIPVDITLIASDVDEDPLTFTVVDGPTNGTLSGNGATLTYTPNAGYIGTDSFTFRANDGQEDSNLATVTIQVTEVNTPPVADDQDVSTDEDTPVDITLTGSDDDGDPLTFDVVDGPTNGVLSGSGAMRTYTPDADYNGPDSFTFRVNDGQADSDPATVSITVAPVNDPPVADDQAVSTIENTPVDITLTASDVDADPLTFDVVDGPANGTLSGSGAELTYTPNAGYLGPDNFAFRANDGTADSNLATVSVTVSPSGPTAQLEFGSLTVGADYVTVDLDNTYVSPVVVCSAQYEDNTTPVVVRVSNVTPTSFDVRLQNPSGGGVAAENVSYLVVEEGTWAIDGVNLEAQIYLSTVTDEDGSWVGEPQSYGQSYANPVVLGQVMSDNDPDWSTFWCQGGSRSDPPSATALTTGKMVGEDTDATREDETIGFIVFEAGHGTIGGVEYEAALGADTVQGVGDSPPYVYTFNTAFAAAPQVVVATLAGMDGPNGGWAQAHGSTLATTTSLYLSIDEDQVGDSERNHITEQVGYVAFGGTANIPPVAVDDSANTDEDTAVTIAVLANDSDEDEDTLTVSSVTQPPNGSVVNNGTDVTYTPDADYCGSDSFGYTASDGNGGSDTATVDVSVSCVNDAPVADEQNVSTQEGMPVGIALTASDVDGDALTFEVVGGPTNGTLSGSGANLTYTPDAGYVGPDSFTFRANDGQEDSNIATVSIEVTEVDTPPVADDQDVNTDEDTPVDITLTGSDEDGDPLTFEVVDGPTNGILSGSGANLTYTPDADYNGPDSFTFRVNDGQADSDPATVSITVNPVNDPPLADDQAVSTNEDTPVGITLIGSDVDEDMLTFAVLDGPDNGTLTGSGANLTYTPDAGYTGEDSFTFRANDGQEDSNLATVSISVVGGNYALSFDGNDDILRAAQVPGTGPLTVEAWVRPDDNNANGLMIVGADDYDGWSLELNSGQLTLWLSTNQGWQLVQHETALQAGQWVHVAATYQNGTARAFVDGVASPAASVGTLTQGPSLSMGGFAGYPFFDGTIDEVRISNVVRYTSDFAPSGAPFSSDVNTLGLWHFDEGAGQTAADASTSANDGTLGNSNNADSADPTWVEGYP
jgi:hypothetical protein